LLDPLLKSHVFFFNNHWLFQGIPAQAYPDAGPPTTGFALADALFSNHPPDQRPSLGRPYRSGGPSLF